MRANDDDIIDDGFNDESTVDDDDAAEALAQGHPKSIVPPRGWGSQTSPTQFPPPPYGSSPPQNTDYGDWGDQ